MSWLANVLFNFLTGLYQLLQVHIYPNILYAFKFLTVLSVCCVLYPQLINPFHMVKSSIFNQM